MNRILLIGFLALSIWPGFLLTAQKEGNIWYFGNKAAGAEVERQSAGNMKRTWVEWHSRDWLDGKQGEGREFLREATQVKNIWIPYGE